MEKIIIKQNYQGKEVWRYDGRTIERGENYLIIEAFFDRDDMDFHGLSLCKGDRFIETYFFDRWYNIFEIYDRDDGRLKGWYCNVSSPATENNSELSYQDYALDLLVFPDGQQIVLDEDEFAALSLSPRERETALAALVELQNYFKEKLREDE
jgi:uncharacterized protein